MEAVLNQIFLDQNGWPLSYIPQVYSMTPVRVFLTADAKGEPVLVYQQTGEMMQQTPPAMTSLLQGT